MRSEQLVSVLWIPLQDHYLSVINEISAILPSIPQPFLPSLFHFIHFLLGKLIRFKPYMSTFLTSSDSPSSSSSLAPTNPILQINTHHEAAHLRTFYTSLITLQFALCQIHVPLTASEQQSVNISLERISYLLYRIGQSFHWLKISWSYCIFYYKWFLLC